MVVSFWEIATLRFADYTLINFFGKIEKCFYSRIEMFLTANRKYSDRE